MRITLSRRERYRAYPTPEQTTFIRQQCGNRRWLWNRYVQQGNEQEQAGEPIQASSYTVFYAEAPWLKDGDSCNLDLTKRDYTQAWQNYWKTPSVGKPKKKKRGKCKESYSTTNNPYRNKEGKKIQSIQVTKGFVKLPKMTPIRIREHRPLPPGHRIKRATIIEESRTVFYISISYDYEVEIPDYLDITLKQMIGLDYSSPSFYVDQNGESPELHHFFRESEEKLAAAQQIQSRRNYKSKGWYEAKNASNKIQGKTRRCRKDFTEKLSASISEEYALVFVEDINLRGMAGSLKLGKSTNDNGFGMFRNQLIDKLTRKGGGLVKVPKFFPSSKLCGECGYKYSQLSLEEREWDCPQCKTHHVRDKNAGKNIQEMGLFGLLLEGYISDLILDTGDVIPLNEEYSADDFLLMALGCQNGTVIAAYRFITSACISHDGKSASLSAITLLDSSARSYVEAKRKLWKRKNYS